VKLLEALIHIAVKSEEKEGKIEKRKKRGEEGLKVASTKVYDDYDKLIDAIGTPFKNEQQLDEIFTEMFLEMKHSNSELFNNIFQILSHEDTSAYSNYVNFELLEKKKPRVIRKVVGIKMGAN
jgi:hypothetical protein